LIIALTKNHTAAEQLAKLSAVLRAQRRQEPVEAPEGFSGAINITETSHGNNTATYMILPGRASSKDAITSYQYIRKHYPSVLDVLCHAAARNRNHCRSWHYVKAGFPQLFSARFAKNHASDSCSFQRNCYQPLRSKGRKKPGCPPFE